MRRQLTLFVAGGVAADIDNVRQRVDPVQFGLIAAHVTLCREDELAELSERELVRRLSQAPANIAASYAALQTRLTVTFTAVALIEQRDAHPWVVRATVPLDRRDDSVPFSPPS